MIQKVNNLLISKVLERAPLVMGVHSDTGFRIERTSDRGWGACYSDAVFDNGCFQLFCPCNGYKGTKLVINDNLHQVSCPDCGKELTRDNGSNIFLVPDFTAKEIKREFLDSEYSHNYIRLPFSKQKYEGRYRFDLSLSYGHFRKTAPIKKFYYVTDTPQGGIDVVRVSIKLVMDEDCKVRLEESYDNFAEIVPGKKVEAYKKTKARGVENIDFFDAFHITNKDLLVDEEIYFENCKSMIEFCFYNQDFCNKTGFQKMLESYNNSKQLEMIPENSFFLLYMYLYSQYPIIEQLAKNGYVSLVQDLIIDICNSYSRQGIKDKVSRLNDLLKIGVTKGSQALSIPAHVGQYLREKNASVEEYLSFAAINEREELSVERFEKLLKHEGFLYLNFHKKMTLVPDIMKYGYTLSQVLKYVTKQLEMATHRSCITSMDKNLYGTVQLFHDYLLHCELMEVKPQKFPQDIEKAHNDLMVAYTAYKNAAEDKIIEKCANTFKDFKSASKYLDVVFPRNVQDFVNEGINQHNCVGGYHSPVARGQKVIFFIRKKDNLSKSYITAECLKNGLGQLMYRGNMPVVDYTEKEFAKAVCKFILSKKWGWAKS